MTSLGAVRDRAIGRPLALSLLARLPVTAIGLLMLLRARELGFSYATAGAVTAAFAIGMGAAAALQGKLVDRFGPVVVLRLGGLVAAAILLAITAVPDGSPLVLALLASLCGFAQPPIGPCLRALWSRVLTPAQRNAAFAVEATLQEIVFVLGPLLLVSIAAATSTGTALLVAAGMQLLGTAAFSFAPEVRAVRILPRHARADAQRPLASAPIRALLAFALLLGVCFGATEVSIVAFAEYEGVASAAGLLIGVWCVGSLIGGLTAGHRVVHALRESRLLLIVFAVANGLLALAPGVAWLIPALLLSGAAMAPLMARLYGLVGTLGSPATITEAYSLTNAAALAGLAVGPAIGGAAAGARGPGAGFLVGSAAALAGIAFLTLRAGAIAAPTAPADPADDGVAAPAATPQPPSSVGAGSPGIR